MSLVSQFIDDIRTLIKKEIRASNIDGIVTSIDETKFTCTVKIPTTEAVFYDVPLRVLISLQASFVEIPKVNTECVLSFRDMNPSRPQLLFIHESAKILIKIESTTAQIDSTGIIFNNGTLDGLVKVNEIVSKLNILENDLNSIKNVFSSWTPVPQDGGAALKTASTTWASSTLTTTVKEDLENTKIKQ